MFKTSVMTLSRLLALSVIFSAHLAYAGETVPTEYTEQMLFADDPKTWLTVAKVVQPVYPAEMLAAGTTGYVDAVVTIDFFGGVKSIGAVTSKPQNAEFEKAARESLQYWVFRSSLTQKCTPEEAEGSVRIWFDIENGKGKVSVSSTTGTMRGERKAGDPRWSQILNRAEVTKETIYPRLARKEGMQAAVYAVMHVNAASGTVDDVDISHTIPDKPAVRKVFSQSVINALKIARFDAKPEMAGKNVNVCFTFQFRLVN